MTSCNGDESAMGLRLTAAPEIIHSTRKLACPRN